jgi:2-polyprenyl-6-methoxyphenol hydroxylase-like FAD-dependent oxidoreductase
VHLAILGAGPAGLLFALLIRRRFPRWQVHVYEQNAADATFGFGVVFSQGALAFLERDAPELHAQLLLRMEHWPIQRIAHRGESIDIDGNGFSAVARLELNRFLQQLCKGRRCVGAIRKADRFPSGTRGAGPDRRRLTARIRWCAASAPGNWRRRSSG